MTPPAARIALVEDSGPKQTEVSITYSVSCRVNLGNYEHSDAFISKGERYDVTGLTPEEVEAFYQERYAALHDELGKIIEDEYFEMLPDNRK
jgi:hypothetical protein